MGALENELQKLQIPFDFTSVFSIPVKFEFIFSGFLKNLLFKVISYNLLPL